MVLSFVPQAKAAGFNDDPKDLPTVTVSNRTTNPCSNGLGIQCWSPSISNVSAGDIVSVQIYFHNTGSQPVGNVSLFMSPQTTGSTTSQTFSGGVKVNGATVASGSGSVSLNSSQTLTFISGSVLLMKTQGTTNEIVLNENDLFSGAGVAIGSVGTGWANQGTIRARFQVSNNGSGGNSCFINSFTANGSSYATINQGNSANLAWATTGCTSASISSFGNVSLSNSGYSVTPSYTTTYTLTAYGSNGVAQTQNVTVNVNNNYNNICDATLTVDQNNINQGSSTILRWTTSGMTSSPTIYPNVGSQGYSGSAYISPQVSTTYTLTAYGCGTSYTRSVTINVNTNIVIPTNNKSQVITTVANVTGGSQAKLNGIVIPNTTYGTTSAWFEWGLNGNSLSNTTYGQIAQNNSSSNYYSDNISGLASGRVYYYRAVAKNQNGVVYGEIVRFQIPVINNPTVYVPPKVVTITNTVTANSAPSLLELRVDSNYNTMCVEGIIDYTIYYRNVSNQVLQNAVLRFTNPKEVTFLSASRGSYEVVDRILTIPLSNIAVGEQGTITVRASINNNAVNGNLTVTTASVVYTNSITKAQEDAIAYSLITISDTCPSNLGASSVGFGAFLPHTLLGWLLIILVIFILTILGRHFYYRRPPIA